MRRRKPLQLVPEIEIRPSEFGILFSMYQELSRIADDGSETFFGEAAIYLSAIMRTLGDADGKKWTAREITACLPQLALLCSTSEFQDDFLKTFLFSVWEFLREEAHQSAPRGVSRVQLLKDIVTARKKYAVGSLSDYEVQVSKAIDALPITAYVREDVERFGLKPCPLFEVEGGGPLVLQVIASACFEKFHREDGLAAGDWLGLLRLKKHALAYDFFFMVVHPTIWLPMARSWDAKFYASARTKKEFDLRKWWLFTTGFIHQDNPRFNQEEGDGIIRSQAVAESLAK